MYPPQAIKFAVYDFINYDIYIFIYICIYIR